MTVHIHVAPHPDALVSMLCERLISDPPDPFTSEVISVPTRGIERWLTQRIALELAEVAGGIAAHIEFPTPQTLVRTVTAGVPDLAASLAAWEGPGLQTTVMAVIDQTLDEPWMALIHRHLDTPASSRMAAAAKVARLFAAYARRRPNMIAAWGSGKDLGPGGEALSEHHSWQPQLWRSVRQAIGLPTPVELGPRALDPIRNGVGELPARVSLYGLTATDPFDLAVLVALGETRDVLLHVLHPSPALWGDVGGVPMRVIDREADPTAALTEHPLLSAWGRDSRELQVVLANAAPHAAVTQAGSRPGVGQPDTLLGRLQSGIRANSNVSRADPDRSIQIHVCHGARRQVEVVRDAVLHIMAAEPTLESRDIVIMTPDLTTFAPLLEAGFPQGDGDGLPDLRVRIADRSPAATNPLVRFAAGILDLADGRLDASAVRELVTRPVVQRRFAFDGDTAAAITIIIDDATISWGLDPAHREWWGLGEVSERTWSRGLDRALAGVFYSDSPVRVVGDVAPLDGVEGQDANPVGILSAIIDRIAAIRAELSEPMPMSDWALAIGDATRMLADPGWDDEWQWAQLERLLVQTFPAVDGLDPPVSLTEARRAMAAWTDDRPSPLHFRTGDVTVCTLAPMRSVPYRVVCLLGLDDDRFPRTTRSDGDDLLAGHELVGDHDRSGEDRQLLLDAVMAAGEHLVITYSGRDEITNAVYPPAVPIAELMDVLSEMTGRQPDELETRHPLQSFSEAVFTDGALGVEGPWGFDPIQRDGARAVQERDQLALDLPNVWVGAPPPDVVRLDDLVGFLVNPIKGFVRATLGFGIPKLEDLPDDALPVTLDGLANWALKDRLIDGLALGHTLDALIDRERGADHLPPGGLATKEIERARKDVEELWAAAVSRGYHQPQHRRFLGELDVAGRLVEGSVSADPIACHIASVTPSKVKAKQRLRLFVEVAFLTAIDPDRPWHALLLARRANGAGWHESVIGPLGDTAEQRRETAMVVLERLVAIFDEGHRRPIALPCETGWAWHHSVTANRTLDTKEAKAAFETGYSAERDEPAHRLVFPDITTLEHLVAAGFEAQAAGLWGLVEPHVREGKVKA